MEPLPQTPDARPRLAAYAILVAATMFLLSSVAAMAAALAYVVLLHAAAGRGRAELTRDLRRMGVFVVVVVALNALVTPGRVILSVGSLMDFTWQGVVAGAFFATRLLVLYLATALLVRTTPAEEMAAAVFATIRPVSRRIAERLAFQAFVTASFVPVFGEEMERVRIAQSFRGGSMAGGLFDRVRAARLLVVPLLLSAVHRSSQLAMVTQLRGVESRIGEVLAVRGLTARDAVLPLLTAVVVAAAWMLH